MRTKVIHLQNEKVKSGRFRYRSPEYADLLQSAKTELLAYQRAVEDLEFIVRDEAKKHGETVTLTPMHLHRSHAPARVRRLQLEQRRTRPRKFKAVFIPA